MTGEPVHHKRSTELVISFLLTGGSGLLLALAHIFPELWFLSLFALVPFLWHVERVDLTGAVLLGFLMAICYVFGANADELLTDSKTFVLRLILVGSAFAVFGVATNLTRRSPTLSSGLIVLLWFPVQYALIRYAGLGQVFSVSDSGSNMLVSVCSVLGVVAVALAITLVNLIAYQFIKSIVEKIGPRVRRPTDAGVRFRSLHEHALYEAARYCFPDRRAPPVAFAI